MAIGIRLCKNRLDIIIPQVALGFGNGGIDGPLKDIFIFADNGIDDLIVEMRFDVG